MSDIFVKGIAFILEGQTELTFYPYLLKFFCSLHENYTLTEVKELSDLDKSYILTNNLENTKIIIKLHCFSTITQIVHSSKWFNSFCYEKHKKTPWDVFLCYDTDSHNDNITKFYEGDWKELRKNITHKNTKIFDMAASADIEDLFLKDLEAIQTFCNTNDTIQEEDIPKGRKGKGRLKELCRRYGVYYHHGSRAEPLIKCLNMNTLINSGLLPLKEIEISCFS